MRRGDEARERDGAAAVPRARRRAGPVPSPAVVGQRLLRPRPVGFAQLQRRNREWRAQRQATLAAETAALLEAPLAELVTRVKTRQWTAITMHLLGATLAEIAAAVGFTQPRTALTLLRRPESQRLITLIRQAQLQKILDGEYGVQATAKAAAPRIMAQVAALAGGVPGPDGGPRGRAKRDADTIRAADLALTIAGHKVERQAHVHVHLLEEMSEGELEALAERGVWPERYASVPALLTAGSGLDSCNPADVAADNPSQPPATGAERPMPRGRPRGR